MTRFRSAEAAVWADSANAVAEDVSREHRLRLRVLLWIALLGVEAALMTAPIGLLCEDAAPAAARTVDDDALSFVFTLQFVVLGAMLLGAWPNAMRAAGATETVRLSGEKATLTLQLWKLSHSRSVSVQGDVSFEAIETSWFVAMQLPRRPFRLGSGWEVRVGSSDVWLTSVFIGVEEGEATVIAQQLRLAQEQVRLRRPALGDRSASRT